MKDVQLTRNFKLSEFQCKDGSDTPAVFFSHINLLAHQLQMLRDHLNEPIHILSGYRSIPHNTKVGGSPHSMHLIGKASDIWCKNHEPIVIIQIIEDLIDSGFMKQGGLGIYKTFVHYDIRGNKARWDLR